MRYATLNKQTYNFVDYNLPIQPLPSANIAVNKCLTTNTIKDVSTYINAGTYVMNFLVLLNFWYLGSFVSG